MKLKKLLCLVLTLAMVASTFTALTFTTTAAGGQISISYDISGLSAKDCDTKVSHAREYQEYKTGDNVSSLGAYKAHNMVFDGGVGSGSMTYLSPNPLGYWTNNWSKRVAIDYGGMGTLELDTADVSYMMYKVESGSPIGMLTVKLYGALAPSLHENKNGGWAQMAVYAFAADPSDSNGRIDFSQYQGLDASNVIGDMHAVHDFYNTPTTFDLTETALGFGGVNTIYVVVACLASGEILEKVDDRLSGFGGQNGAPVFRLSGVEIFTGGDDTVYVYVSKTGNDSNNGLTPDTAVKTVAKANQIAASKSDSSRVKVVFPEDMLTLNAATYLNTAKTTLSNATVQKYLPGIACWGDSLTAGVTTTGYDGESAYNPYPIILGDLVKSNLISDFDKINRANFGIGGENAATIVARSNGIPAVLGSSITIPASGTSGAFTIKLQGYNDSVTPLVQSNSMYTGDVSKVTINGISGTLKLSGSQYTFTRDTAGSAASVASGSQIVFTAGNQFDNSNYIPVVFMGYNDGAATFNSNISKYTTYIDSILNKYPQYRNNGRYIVVAPHFKKDMVSTVKSIEAALEAKYGSHLIKTREFMSTYGPYEMDIAPNSADYAMMAAGQVPNCLMSTDDTHYSKDGFALVARLIFQRMYDLGYFDEIIRDCDIDTSKWAGPNHFNPYTPDKPVPPIPGQKQYLQLSDESVLSINKNYDEYTHKNGKRSVESCVTENKYLVLDDTNCNKYGAELAHNVFIDGSKTGSIGNTMTYIHPGSYELYDGTYAESGNAIEADFTNPSTINSSYNFSYMAYRISAGSGKSLASLNVNLYGALWPSVIDGKKNDSRYQFAVYVTNNITKSANGAIDFSDIEGGLVFAKGDKSQYPDAYSESSCYKIDCSAALANKDLMGVDNVGDIYVIVVLACTGWGIGESTDRLSPYQTTTSLRYTGIKIDATTKNVAADPVPEPPKPDDGCTHSNTTFVPAVEASCTVNGNIAYYVCNDCGKYFSDSACKNEIELSSTVVVGAHKYAYTGYEGGHVGVCSCGAQTAVEPHTPDIPAPTATQGQYCTLCNWKISDPISGGDTLAGDANGDGKVTVKDAKYLLNHNAFPSKYPIDSKQNTDYNNDGYTDADDVDYLLMHIFVAESFPLYPGK